MINNYKNLIYRLAKNILANAVYGKKSFKTYYVLNEWKLHESGF